MTLQREIELPDFIVGGDRAFRAVYPVSPDILEKESLELIGVPFLFDGERRAELPLQQIAREWQTRGIDYLSIEDYYNMLQGARKIDAGRPSKPLIVGGREFPVERIVDVAVIFGSYYKNMGVYFFEVRPYRASRKVSVRTKEDYNRMIENVLPSVREERKKSESYVRKVKELSIRLGFLSPSDSKRQFTYTVLDDYIGGIPNIGGIPKKFIDRSYTEYKGLGR